jgi:hypothetical protein
MSSGRFAIYLVIVKTNMRCFLLFTVIERLKTLCNDLELLVGSSGVSYIQLIAISWFADGSA